jgi:hypothetical protein
VRCELHGDGTADTEVRVETHDGRSRGVGFGGPLTYPDRRVNGYVGRKPGFPVIVLARMAKADEVRTAYRGEVCEPLWAATVEGVTYLLELFDDDGAWGGVEIFGSIDGVSFREQLLG